MNSYHELAVDNLPQMWRSIAYAEDGVLEAMAHLELPWRGIMWHPERESSLATEDLSELLQLFAGGQAQ